MQIEREEAAQLVTWHCDSEVRRNVIVVRLGHNHNLASLFVDCLLALFYPTSDISLLLRSNLGLPTTNIGCRVSTLISRSVSLSESSFSSENHVRISVVIWIGRFVSKK